MLKQICHDPSVIDGSIEKIISRPPITIDGSAAIGQATALMVQNKIRRLLVTRNAVIIGIITERDLMRATLDLFKKLSDAWV